MTNITKALDELETATSFSSKSARDNHAKNIAALRAALQDKAGEAVAYRVDYPGVDSIGLRRFFGADQWEASKRTVEFLGGVAVPLFSAQPAPVVPDGWEWPDVVREKLARFMECAEDGDADGVDIGRNWLDALTVIGLLRRAQRSPALWEMTDAGHAMIAASQQKVL